MFKKASLLVLLLLIFLSVGVVSANDNIDGNYTNDILDTSGIAVDDALSASSYVITKDNYNQYFDNEGNAINTVVKSGDTVNFQGDFSNLRFAFNTPVTIVGDSTHKMTNVAITLNSGASGSSVSNLNIANTKSATWGLFLNSASKCTIKNCIITNTGSASYCISLANGANYNNITDNTLTGYGECYGHGTRSIPALLVSGSNYNYLANNHVEVDDANGIYLSSYSGSSYGIAINGGESFFNTIYNNTVKYNVLPTSWAYGIQIMGGNNTIKSNTIIGGYRGVSTAGSGNIILTGADYNNLGVEVGGEFGIVGSYDSIVINNTITGAKIIATGAGISIIDNGIAQDNYVDVTLKGRGIVAAGSNVEVKNNKVFTQSGSGIYEKDEGSGLLIDGNEITSDTGICILIEKLSSKRMPSDVTITNNVLYTNNEYAIDVSGVKADTAKIESNNVGSGKILSPSGVVDPSKPAYNYKGTTHIITSSNIRQYINDNGGLTSKINDGDILNFQGTFSNEIIYVTKAVKITGNNPIFYNSSFKVTCGNVLIENLNIINANAERVNAWGIFVYQAPGVRIQNNNISVNDPNAAYAVYVLESTDVDVINNYFVSEGNYLTFTLLSYASEECNFANNTINTIGTGEVYNFEPEKCIDGNELCLDGSEFCLDGGHIVSEIYRTYGILLLYSSNNVVSQNNVNVTSRLDKQYATTGNGSSTNSIVGIDLYYNSHNNVFSNNNVYVNGNDNYIYGMGVLGYYTGHNAPEGQGATNNSFIQNTITLEGPYFTTGIIVGDESENTYVENNIINAKSEGVVYGITLEMPQSTYIQENVMNLDSQVVYGIHDYSSNTNLMAFNKINATGKQVYGIMLSNGCDNNIWFNIINATSTGEAITIKNLDSVGYGNAGIILQANSSNNYIHDNEITSLKGYAISIDDASVDNVVKSNYLDCEKGIGNGAVSAIANNQVSDNYKYFVSANVSTNNISYRGVGEFTLTFSENVDGAVVKLYDSKLNYLTESGVKNNQVTLKYQFDETYAPAQRSFVAKFYKENYYVSIYPIKFVINKGNLDISLNNPSIVQGASGNVIATVLDEFGNPISGATVQFNRINSAGKLTSMGSAKTNAKGVATLSYTAQTSLSEGSHNITAQVSGLDYYNDGDGNSTMDVLIASITGGKDYSVYYGNTVTYKIRVLGTGGKAVGAGESVTFKINGVTKTVKTDANGYASYSAKLSAGKYTITADYKGLIKSNKITFKPTLTAKNVVGKKSKTTKFTVKLVNKNGKILKNKKITIKIKSKKYTAKTNSKGIAALSVKLTKVGKYSVSSSYGGCTIKNTITIKK